MYSELGKTADKAAIINF